MLFSLERLVDFRRINNGEMRFSVGAVNVRTGNFVYFNNTTQVIGPAHVVASGSLPLGFPATEVDGEYYWDGEIISNTPLQWVLNARPRLDTLRFRSTSGTPGVTCGGISCRLRCGRRTFNTLVVLGQQPTITSICRSFGSLSPA